MSPSRLLPLGAALLACLSCSSSSSGGGGVHRFAIDSTEFPFTTPVGAPATSQWQAATRDLSCVLLAPDDTYIEITVTIPVNIEKRDKTGKTVWTSPPITFGDPTVGFDGKCSRDGNLQTFSMAMGADGSSFLVGQVRSPSGLATPAWKLGAALVDASGKIVWAKTLDDREAVTRMVSVLADPSGDFLVTASLEFSASGAIDADEYAILRVGNDGTVKKKAKVDPIHVPEYDHPGGQAPGSTVVRTTSLGTAFPLMQGMAATKDGGFVVVGSYNFGRAIACGTDDDPKDPTEGDSCPQQGSDGALLRYDAGLNLLWSRHYGDGYFTQLNLGHVAELGDGTFVATGSVVGGTPGQYDPPVEALSMGIDRDGTMRWVKSHPWGKKPGATFTQGGVAFEEVVQATAGDVDVVMAPPRGSACLLVRIHEDGTITRTQTLTESAAPFGANGRCWGVTGAKGILVRGEQTLFRFDPIP